MMPWKSLLTRTAAVGAIIGVFVVGAVFMGVRLAGADPGASGGPTLSQFTFAGVLRERASRRSVLTFVFRKGGAAPTSCTSETPAFTPDDAGAFSVVVPIDSPSRCPPQFFDGTDVTYDVLLDGETAPIVSGVGIRPVPYARFADQAGVNNDCPASYTLSSRSPYTVCSRGVDEVVKVGAEGPNASAFWIDRYEATVWRNRDGTGAPLTATTEEDLTSAGLPRNGGWNGRVPPLFALSVGRAGPPSRYVTWFQAQELCRSSGKRLPTGDEWLTASRGATETGCQVNVTNTAPRNTIDGATCVSAWGAQDMIGNVSEWTNEWYAGAGTTTTVNVDVQNWPDSTYGSDGVSNVAGYVARRPGFGFVGLPAAAVRGGNYASGEKAGIFSLLLENAPSVWGAGIGFRCVVRGD